MDLSIPEPSLLPLKGNSNVCLSFHLASLCKLLNVTTPAPSSRVFPYKTLGVDGL